MLPELTRQLLECWPALFPDARAPRSIEYLGLPGAVEGGTTTFIGFSREATEPLFAAKVHRNPDAEWRATNEARILSRLAECDAALASSVPRVLWCGPVCGTWVLIQSMLRGRPMGITLDRSGLPELREAETNLAAVGQWLRSLWDVQAADGALRSSTPAALAEATLAEFRETFRLNAADAGFLAEIEASLDQLVPGSGGLAHGDFCRHNTLIVTTGGRTSLGIIDWTDAEADGLPMHDLLFFLATYFVQVRQKTGLDGIRDAFAETFFGASGFSGLARRVSGECLRSLAVSTDLRLQLGLFVVCQSVKEARKLDCLMHVSGVLPRIALWLSKETGSDFDEARRASFWLYLFRDLSLRSREGSAA